MAGSVGPGFGGLHIDGIRLDFVDEVLGSVGQSSGGVSGTDQVEFSVGGWVLENLEGVFKGAGSGPNTGFDVGFEVRVS